MKIALISPASFPATQFGGIVFLTIDLAREISNLGHDVTIFTSDLDFSDKEKFFNKKLSRLEKFQKFKINRNHSWFAIKLFFITPSIYFELKRYKPDIIHTIGLRSFQSFIAWIISKQYGIPLVVSDQGGLTTHPFLKDSSFVFKIIIKFQNFFIKKFLKDSASISSANEYESKIFLQLYDKSNLTIIRNGVNLESLKSIHDFQKKYAINSKYFLFVGRFSKSKGIENLLKAIIMIKSKLVERKISLVMIGSDFGFGNEMKKIILENQLSDVIKIFNNIPREDVISAYPQSEFLVLPSNWELSPLVPLESFAFKKPVISINTHGIPFTVKHNVNGLLVEPENPLKLSESIINLIDDPQLREKLGLSGYDFVHKECNCITMAEKTLELYSKILNNKKNS